MNNLNLNKKKILVFNNLFSKYNSFILLNIDNVSSLDINILRKTLKKNNCFILFIKKNLFIKYLTENCLLNLNKLNILGQTCIVFYNNNLISIIKIINKFIINNNNIKIANLYSNKNLYNRSDIKLIIDFPDDKFFIKKFINLLKNISILKVLKVLNIIKLNKN